MNSIKISWKIEQLKITSHSVNEPQNNYLQNIYATVLKMYGNIFFSYEHLNTHSYKVQYFPLVSRVERKSEIVSSYLASVASLQSMGRRSKEIILSFPFLLSNFCLGKYQYSFIKTKEDATRNHGMWLASV